MATNTRVRRVCCGMCAALSVLSYLMANDLSLCRQVGHLTEDLLPARVAPVH